MDAGSGRSKTTLKAGDFMPFEQEDSCGTCSFNIKQSHPPLRFPVCRFKVQTAELAEKGPLFPAVLQDTLRSVNAGRLFY